MLINPGLMNIKAGLYSRVVESRTEDQWQTSSR
jgi:hypothetical protein